MRQEYILIVKKIVKSKEFIVTNKRIIARAAFGYRKDILISKYGCSPSDTEHNFCKSKGWYRIYDCGTKVYKWKKQPI